MPSRFETLSPADGRVVAAREHASSAEITRAVDRARAAQRHWRTVSVAERAALCTAMVEAFEARRDEIAREITLQMGRPLAASPGEVGGYAERARAMIDLAGDALADLRLPDKAGFDRFIRREPLGVVLTIAPWNYPYLTAVNSIVPAIMAGNAVVVRHSTQTPLCAERIVEAFEAAGAPDGLVQFLHTTHADTERLVGSPGVDFVAFTGSVGAGRRVQGAAAERFIGIGLELGGKDPGYVRADADVAAAADGLVDGAFFNSGQSCCGIERIYVHQSVYDDFVGAARERVGAYRLGDPLEPDTNLGPMVNAAAADFVRGQVDEAVAAGAESLVDPAGFDREAAGSAYCAPRLLVEVDHSMRVMTEESFGPVVGVMKVRDDDEAVTLMNDSDFGLTASVWTRDPEAAIALGDRIETGTWFMNRCDYLDPELAWTGVKDSGRGCTLSRLGYEFLTRPKSFHLRTG